MRLLSKKQREALNLLHKFALGDANLVYFALLKYGSGDEPADLQDVIEYIKTKTLKKVKTSCTQQSSQLSLPLE